VINFFIYISLFGLPANHSYFEDDVTHLYRKVDRDTTNIPKTKNADNIAPPNIISFILIALFNYSGEEGLFEYFLETLQE